MTESGAAARAATVARIERLGAVVVLRLKASSRALEVVEAMMAGGIAAIEVTMTTPDALQLIAQIGARYGDDAMVGVGSVLDVDTARRAVDAGARYVVSPVFLPELVAESHRLGVAAMPGAFTPTEILAAHRAGADVVKVFPSEGFGTPFFKGVLAPMPFLRLMPTGGVTADNAGEWIRAGAVAVGVGSALMDPKLIAAGDYAGITARARRIVGQIALARGGP